jgi:hypothetical protein
MGVFLLCLGVASYFVPLIVALSRNHRQTLAIGLLNLFLGWTVVGWVVGLVWAVTAPAAPVVVYRAE